MLLPPVLVLVVVLLFLHLHQQLLLCSNTAAGVCCCILLLETPAVVVIANGPGKGCQTAAWIDSACSVGACVCRVQYFTLSSVDAYEHVKHHCLGMEVTDTP